MTNQQIVLIHGTDYKAMTMQLLEHVRLTEMIGDKNARVALKPNLVTATDAASGAVTHPEIVDGVLTYLESNGLRNLSVIESSWVGARTSDAYRSSGLKRVCEQHRVPFIDLQKDDYVSKKVADMELKICKQVYETDFLINLPVLKGHCQTVVTCALKNLKGLIPNSEKRRFHAMGLHKPIAYLGAAIHTGIIIVDNICGDLNFEEGGNPVPMNRIFCCTDPVLCDAFVCQTMGVPISEVPYIQMAEALGVGCADITKAEITQLNEGVAVPPHHLSRRVSKLAGYVESKEACSACYGMLIHALDKLDRRNELRGHKEKISIGQGFKGKSGEIGIGSCTNRFDKNLKGCPPSAADILKFLEENWE
ncbi:MAG: DUF362 domain-containing protein [Oscillospiraceae bacterium]|jgi:uncharacterized protein (DUF362 family)